MSARDDGGVGSSSAAAEAPRDPPGAHERVARPQRHWVSPLTTHEEGIPDAARRSRALKSATLPGPGHYSVGAVCVLCVSPSAAVRWIGVQLGYVSVSASVSFCDCVSGSDSASASV